MSTSKPAHDTRRKVRTMMEEDVSQGVEDSYSSNDLDDLDWDRPLKKKASSIKSAKLGKGKHVA